MDLNLKAAATSAQWMGRYTKVMLANYATPSVAFEKGRGSRLWDVQGKEYVDFAAGVAVCSTGHAHPTVAKRIAEQSARLIHTSNLFLVPNQIELAERLIKLSGLDRAFFCNSGTEANEAALKLARYWGHKKGGRNEFIVASHAFHGRTMGALTLTRNPKYHAGYAPLLPGVHEVPFNDLEAMKGAITDKTCAIVVEPIQGESGVNVPRKGYLQGLRDLCDDKGILLVLDEVQTGIGRTGQWFAFQHEKAMPDIMPLAKGLGSGFPVGALLANERANVWEPGAHGTTFGGGPLACAAALATLDVIESERLVQNAAEKGAELVKRLRQAQEAGHVQGVRGQGLLIGFGLPRGTSKAFKEDLVRRGLLVTHIGEKTIRMAPPLVLNNADLDAGWKILSEALAANASA